MSTQCVLKNIGEEETDVLLYIDKNKPPEKRILKPGEEIIFEVWNPNAMVLGSAHKLIGDKHATK